MAALPFPPTAIASSSSVLVVASGAELHLVANGTSSSAAPAADLDEKAQATGMIRKLTLNADSTLAVSAHDDKTLRVWNISETGISLRSSRPTFKRVASVSFTAANELVVTDKVGDVFL
jgi:WD40 repeat protein